MTDTSNSVVGGDCSDGWVDDQILLYTPAVCILNPYSNFVLSVLWICILGLCFMELLVSRILGPRMRWNAQFLVDLAYFIWNVSCLVLFVLFVSIPDITVMNQNQGVGLWICIWLGLLGMLGFASTTASKISVPLVASLNLDDAMAKHEARFFQILEYLQRVTRSSFLIIGLITLGILANVLPNNQEREMSVQAGFIAWSVCSFLSTAALAVTFERVRHLVVHQLKFHQSFPNLQGREDQQAALSALAGRMRGSAIRTFFFSGVAITIFILIGARVIQLNWIVIHVIFGALPSLAMPVTRTVQRDSFVAKFLGVHPGSQSSSEKRSHDDVSSSNPDLSARIADLVPKPVEF